MSHRRLLLCLFVSLAAVASAPHPAAAQQAKVDSLEARIRELEARLDSLLSALERGQPADSAAGAATDELEALRAAARAAAGGEPQDTTASSRTDNLNIFNPEISVTGDVLGLYVAPVGEDNSFTAVPREFEFSFQAALDPYTRTKIFVTHEQDFEIAGLAPAGEEEEGHPAVEIEEGYIYWIGLPAVGLKVGKIRQEIGLYNRWHTHALLEVDRPLATVAFLGEDGLLQTGLSIASPSFFLGPGTQTLTIELTRGNNQALFENGNQISFLGNFRSFWDISDASYLQFGVSGVYGENDDLGLTSRLLGLDLSYRWRPPGRALYSDFTLKAEWYFANKRAESDLSGDGGYLQANYRLGRRWVLGARADFLDDFGDGPDILQLVPTITWWQSEWVRLRFGYNYVKPDAGDGNHTLIAQIVWAAGPHKHETY